MTIARRNDIALLVMGFYLQKIGFPAGVILNERHEEDLSRLARACAQKTGEKFINVMRYALSSGMPYPANAERDAYSWLKFYLSNKSLTFNNAYRRRIGGIAEKIEVSHVQLIEFFRVLCVDIVNKCLEQTEKEARLKR